MASDANNTAAEPPSLPSNYVKVTFLAVSSARLPILRPSLPWTSSPVRVYAPVKIHAVDHDAGKAATTPPLNRTPYASCGDLSLAYQVFGDGPVELVFVGPMVSHVELFWTMSEFKAFFEQLATFCRVVMFDKAGVGLSDPVPKVRTLDDRAAEIEAVMDTVGFGKAVLFGMSEVGPASIVFAAKRPERTRALILYGAYSFLGGT
jgi:hypothetical protein